MNSVADKALSLCREYDALMSKVSQLTMRIGDSLSACPRSSDPEARITAKGLPYTHLSEAFDLVFTDDNYGKSKREADKAEILSICPHCAAAFEHVKERKAAKKRLGSVKRAIRLIGRSIK